MPNFNVAGNQYPKVMIEGPSGFVADVDSTGHLLTSAVGTTGPGTFTTLTATGVSTFGSTGQTIIDATGTVTKYRGINLVTYGFPTEVTAVDLTAQTAAKGLTGIYTVPFGGSANGMYRISWSATVTTAASVSSTLGGTNGLQIVYTSPTDSVVKTTVASAADTSSANTTGTAVGGTKVIYAANNTAISYQFDYTSSGTAMAYELHLKLEAM